MIWCWLAKIRSSWISVAFGKAYVVGGCIEGSFSVFLAEDFVDLNLACVAVLLNLGPKVNSSRVLSVVWVAGIS